jgi:hypothetical protein
MPVFAAQVLGQAMCASRPQDVSVHAAYGSLPARTAPSFERYL